MLKIAKRIKLTFFSRMAWYIWLIFRMKHKWDLAIEIKLKKKMVAELGHSDLLPVYESNFAEMPISLFTRNNGKYKTDIIL